MKLLGVELTDFACFDRQFVPIQPGINLLVGRNNAGKTAILRALSALAALPLEGFPQMPEEILGYCRNQNATYGFDVLYRLEESESGFFHLPQGLQNTATGAAAVRSLTEELKKGNAVARWRFVVFAHSRQLGFIGCKFEFSGPDGLREAEVFTNSGGGLLRRHLRLPDFSADNTTVHEVPNLSAPDGRSYPSIPSEISTPLRVFGAVKVVNPHRVVWNRQQLQTTLTLPSNAQTLGPFLQTLQGNDRDTFERIETFVTRVFPEFRHINPASSENNQLSIHLTETGSNRKISLENCGTGVEQIITLGTFILTTPKPGTILLDEPHSYLHPTAERALFELLDEHSEHTYMVSTHSAVLMNSVSSDRIIHVVPPGQPFKTSPNLAAASNILLDLGYKNSDTLFYDQLVFVEGKSDRGIIPKLLEKDQSIDQRILERTGFPVVEGTGSGSTALQVSIHRYEKLLASIAGREQTRVYVFDGDRKNDEKTLLLGTKNPNNLEDLPVKFLPRLEIENYLLVPEAITSAIREERFLKGDNTETTLAEVRTELDRLLASDDPIFFPQGKKAGGNALKEAKGSHVLEQLYDTFGLPYHKEHSGLLIAKYITPANQPALSELAEVVACVFPKVRQANRGV